MEGANPEVKLEVLDDPFNESISFLCFIYTVKGALYLNALYLTPPGDPSIPFRTIVLHSYVTVPCSTLFYYVLP